MRDSDLRGGRFPCPECKRKGVGQANHPHAFGYKDPNRASCRFCRAGQRTVDAGVQRQPMSATDVSRIREWMHPDTPWTSAFPTADGVYWCKIDPKSPETLAQVYHLRGGRFFTVNGRGWTPRGTTWQRLGDLPPAKAWEFFVRLGYSLVGGSKRSLLWWSESGRYVIVRRPGNTHYVDRMTGNAYLQSALMLHDTSDGHARALMEIVGRATTGALATLADKALSLPQ